MALIEGLGELKTALSADAANADKVAKIDSFISEAQTVLNASKAASGEAKAYREKFEALKPIADKVPDLEKQLTEVTTSKTTLETDLKKSIDSLKSEKDTLAKQLGEATSKAAQVDSLKPLADQFKERTVATYKNKVESYKQKILNTPVLKPLYVEPTKNDKGEEVYQFETVLPLLNEIEKFELAGVFGEVAKNVVAVSMSHSGKPAPKRKSDQEVYLNDIKQVK